MKVLIHLKYNNYLEKKIRALRKHHPLVELHTDIDRAPIKEIRILLGGVIPTDVLESAHALELILVPFTGINHLPLGLLKERGIRVANTHGSGAYVAERVVGMLTSLMGRITEYHNDLRKQRWHGFWIGAGMEDSWTSLRGKTVGILGTGAVGLGCARLLEPFGCRLLGYRRSDDPLPPFEKIYTDIDEVIAQSDVVIAALPLTRETRGILNQERLFAMEGKILVNVARGPVVDEESLYRALSENILSGAALDAWYTYPRGRNTGAPSRFPIHTLNNVLLSPHVGGFTKDALRADIDGSFENLDGYLGSGRLMNEVNLDLEY